MVTFKIVQRHPGLTYILISDIRALWCKTRIECQSARMSQI